MQAQDIMTRRVITVGLETPIPEIAELLITHRISGVPVVDAKNRVLGMVTRAICAAGANWGPRSTAAAGSGC